MLVNMLSALGPLCLRRDKDDREAECVNSFLQFLLDLLEQSQYKAEGEHFKGIVVRIPSSHFAFFLLLFLSRSCLTSVFYRGAGGSTWRCIQRVPCH